MSRRSRLGVWITLGVALGVTAGAIVAIVATRDDIQSEVRIADPYDTKIRAPLVTRVPSTERQSRASGLNEAGMTAMTALRFDDARRQFCDAVLLVPEVEYQVNLATACLKSGRAAEALFVALRLWFSHPPEHISRRLVPLIATIRDEMARRNIAEEPFTPDPSTVVADAGITPTTQLDAAVPPVARRHLPPDRSSVASDLNEQGKQAMLHRHYADASAYFEKAIEVVPAPTYLLNLTISRFQEGKFGMAITAAKRGLATVRTGELAAKFQNLVARIRREAANQNVPLDD